MSPALQLSDERAAALTEPIRKAASQLLARQDPAGFWWGELTADSTLESDYILLQLWMHPPQGAVWNPPTRELIGKAVKSILDRQLPDGGFNVYAKGPSDVSATIKAYFALKLAGVDYNDPALARARDRILALGGFQAANSYVKINLSLFDLYPREHVPTVPPEIVLLGNFLYQMSSWTRAIVVSLAIVHAHNPRRPVPDGFNLNELFLPGVPLGFGKSEKAISWRSIFLALDRALKLWERHGSERIRKKAIWCGFQSGRLPGWPGHSRVLCALVVFLVSCNSGTLSESGALSVATSRPLRIATTPNSRAASGFASRSATICRYRSSKTRNGKIIPGNKTVPRGNSGSNSLIVPDSMPGRPGGELTAPRCPPAARAVAWGGVRRNS